MNAVGWLARGRVASAAAALLGLLTCGIATAQPEVVPLAGGNVAVDTGRCTVLFTPRGNIQSQGSTCSRGDVSVARNAFESYQREQGGGEAPPGGFGGPAAPQITVVDGGNVAVDMGGCNVLFNPRGGIENQGASCSRADVREARDVFDGYRREQSAPASAEAPPGGFGAPGGPGTLTCESINNAYQYCRHAIGRNEVRVQRRLSSARCNQGSSWDYDADGVWVQDGCRAVFEIR